MRRFLAPVVLGLALAGCVHTGMWSEAPPGDYHRGDYYHGGHHGSRAPVGWWGSNAASIDVFYAALAPHGRWDIFPGYGRVFIPAGVGPDWRPYSRGHWVQDPRFGRRWVSAEPFGWATFHYGRWGRDSRLGWFWVPGTRFGPSWVEWRSYGGYCSWAPLPPIGWNRFARGGHGWGNDWWLHAPSAHAWRPGLWQHVRRGRPDPVVSRPREPRLGPGLERPRGDDWRDPRSRPAPERQGRHPRSAPGIVAEQAGDVVAPVSGNQPHAPRDQIRSDRRSQAEAGRGGDIPPVQRSYERAPRSAPVAAPPREVPLRESTSRSSARDNESGAVTSPE